MVFVSENIDIFSSIIIWGHIITEKNRSILKKIRVYLTCEAFKIVISPCMSDILFKITTVNVLWDLTGKKNKEPSQNHIGLFFWNSYIRALEDRTKTNIVSYQKILVIALLHYTS